MCNFIKKQPRFSLVSSELTRSSGVQPGGGAQEKVPGNNQQKQHGSSSGRQAQELLDPLGFTRHAPPAGDRDP